MSTSQVSSWEEFLFHLLRDEHQVHSSWRVAALIAKIDRDYSLQAEVTEYLTHNYEPRRPSSWVYMWFLICNVLTGNLSKLFFEIILYETPSAWSFRNQQDMTHVCGMQIKAKSSKLDEINGVKIKGRPSQNNGDLAGEFFSPYKINRPGLFFLWSLLQFLFRI